MKRFFLFIILFFLSTAVSAAPQIPDAPEDYVSDYARLLSPTDQIRLVQILKEYEQNTTNQIFVAIFPGQLDESIEDFSVKLEEKWKIGQKGKDNGILLVIFPEARKLRIEVGYGLEGAIPDSVANTIIQQDILPAFKEKQYAQGIEKGIQAIIRASSTENFTASAAQKLSDSAFLLVATFLLLFMGPRYIGILISFGLSFAMFGLLLGGLVWLGTFLVYALAYHFMPAKYRYADRIGFWAGGLNNIPGSNSRFGGGGSSGNSSSSGGSGGGGSSGGGGASGRW